jgi:hypothetical protein
LYCNSNYLEAVNPVALGKARAKQFALLKTSPDDCKLGDKVMCVQLHGDASFTGQGVVMESFGLSKCRCAVYEHVSFMFDFQATYHISLAAAAYISSSSQYQCVFCLVSVKLTLRDYVSAISR